MSRFTPILTASLLAAAMPAAGQAGTASHLSYGLNVDGRHAFLARDHAVSPPRPATPGAVADNLNYGGGYVEHNPRAYLVFWGWTRDPAGVAPRLEAFMAGIGGSPWLETQTQYCDGTTGSDLYCASATGHVGNPANLLHGVWRDDADPVPNLNQRDTISTDGDIQAEAIRAAAHFGDHSVDAQYIIATPTGNSTNGFATGSAPATTGWCAYHFAVGDPAHGSAVVYTNLPYQPDAGASCGANYVNSTSAGVLDSISIVEGHEFAESVTDPIPSSGWVSPDANETGDKCAWVNTGPGSLGNITLATGTFAVQSLWSNMGFGGAGECQMVALMPGAPTHPYIAPGGEAVTTGPLPGGLTGQCGGSGPAVGGTCFAIPKGSHSVHIVVADDHQTAVTVNYSFQDGRLVNGSQVQSGQFCTTTTIPVFPDEVMLALWFPSEGSVVGSTGPVPPNVPPALPALFPCGQGAFGTTGLIAARFA
ncbi:MAG: hypothetical protein ACYDAY_06250 [Candidatus Dormibacteria bacterium]